MPEMNRLEKRLVNRRGPRSYEKMLDRMESAGRLALAPTARVLELGAGNGALSALIVDRYHPAKVCVTDYDPEQVAVARKYLESHFARLPESVTCERADAAHLAYPARSFDLVMAHHMLHHLGPVEEICRGLDEIDRVLEPGGRLLYVEMFHKRPIRDHLARRGFTVLFRERAWRFFTTADVVLARSPSPSPPSAPVQGTQPFTA
jgi:ubiquinone/menaquinone biosynthesis C-methylase UbiE